MNFVTLACVAMTSFFLGIGAESVRQSNSSKIKVGDCVRQLGYDFKETVTYVMSDGTLETKYTRVYSDGTTGLENRQVYSSSDASKHLIKEECR